MRKSIFFKYFAITACSLLVCFIILGSVLLIFTNDQWQTDKDQLLSKNVHTVSDFSSSVILSGLDFRGEVSDTVDVIGQIISADIYIVDSNGACVVCSDKTADCGHKMTTIPNKILQKALTQDSNYIGTMGEIYEKPEYTVSTPIIVNNKSVGAVFASTPMAGAAVAVKQMLRLLLVCSLVILLIAFLAVYVISSQMTRPLRQLAAAARKMENGEFVQIPQSKSKDEVGLLVEAFNRMSRSLSQLEGMRRSFISSVSHELKTPMTTMSGFVDGMLDGTIQKEDYPKYLEIVSDETKRLSRLVNSMLQLSRLENENITMNFSSFNVSDLLVRIMLSFENKIEEKCIDIRGLEDTRKIMLYADSDLMYQVLYNLVENAIKFTPENGYIFVQVKETSNKEVEIVIQNSGEGLNSEQLSRVFEKFYKTDRSRSNDKTGMGFGLYIVKTIVGLHHGQILAESVLNNYTRFTVKLPNDMQIFAQFEQVVDDKSKRNHLSGVQNEIETFVVDNADESVNSDKGE